MRKVFWDDPYQTTLTTQVDAVDGNRILFKETIAFSFSGGQESDKAWVNDFEILDSEIKGNLIYYKLPENHRLIVGDLVTMTIDWVRRYKLMKLHFAAELILELITTKLNLVKIGAHIAEKKARIDFFYDQNISHVFSDILAQYNEIIERDLSIITDFDDIAAQRRFWKIECFAKVPCGGTHVRSTKEVGPISLKRVNVGGGKERIEITISA
jgi:Ser-tRNA(Ala) deacylase AlaX